MKLFKAIVGAKLIDGTGKPSIKDATILINGSRIIDVGKNVDIPNGYEFIDAMGKTVMPGLIDAHTHLGAPILPESSVVTDEQNSLTTIRSVRSPMISMFTLKNAQKNLEAGFTTLKELSWVWDPTGSQAIAVRNAINMGFFKGPRIVVYPWVGMTGGHCDLRLWFNPSTAPNLINTGGPLTWFPINTADGISEILKSIRWAMRLGGDGIKTSADSYELWSGERNVNNYTLKELTCVVDETHRHHKLVSMHASSADGIKHAISSGVDIIEHCTNPHDEDIKKIINNNIITTATIGWMGRPKPLPKIEETWDSKSPYYQRNLIQKDLFYKKYEAGVKIAMGTDACHDGREHGLGAYAIAMMVEFGMSEMEAIVSSTKIGAEACGLDDKLGTLEKGKLADMIMVDGDPLKDIKILMDKKNIDMVMKEGEVLIDHITSRV